MPRTYVDNAYNRRHGRVGLPIGSAVISKNTVCGINTKTYVDNDYNRSLGRVGMSHGSAVMSKYDGLTKWHYLDTDRDRFVHPPSVKPKYEPEFGETNHNWKLLRDLQQIDTKPRNIPKALREFDGQSNDTSKNKTALKFAEAMTHVGEAAFRNDLAQMEFERNMIQRSQSEQQVLQDARLKYTTCIICYNDIMDASITPCGHHFCTHCIIQLLETKRKCPRCQRHVKESELIRDEEFDAIVNDTKRGGRQFHRFETNQETDGTTKMQDLRVELQNTKSENKMLVQKIDMYARQCEQLKQDLCDVKEIELVEQKELVKKLRGQLRWQEEKIQSNGLSKNELEALKNLQTFYERRIRGRTSTEDMSRKLNEYIEIVIDEVCARQDTEDELGSVIRGFTSLIDENFELHRNASKLENQLRSVKRDLHLAKAKIHKLERKYPEERTLDAERYNVRK